MANAIYPAWKAQIMQSGANSSLAGTVKVALVSAAYVYSAAHSVLTSLTGVIGTAQTLGTKTFTNGTFDAADTTWTAVPGPTAATALVIYIDTGTAGTSQLVAYIDTGQTGLPITPNGSNIVMTWNGSGIFTL